MREPLATIPASTVVPTPMSLMWRNRIPVGTLAVVAGKPGLGKSTLSVTIAAELSAEGKTVIMSNLEDDPASVIRPRLDVAGADLDKVLILPAEVVPPLPRGIDQFEELIESSGASALILDPIGAHYTVERRLHDRAILGKMITMARRHQCTIIGIHHSLKVSADGTAIGAIGGPPGGLAGAARAVYLYGYDPSDEDRRALACVKINGIDMPSTLIIEHDPVEYDGGDKLIEAGHLTFVDQTNDDARSVMKPGRKLTQRDEECAAWLTMFLAKDTTFTMQTKEVKTWGKLAGFGWATLVRAGTTLHVIKSRVGWGGEGFWTWSLPPDHPARFMSGLVGPAAADEPAPHE